MFQNLLATWAVLAFVKTTVSGYDASMVHRLLMDREVLIQDGHSYANESTLTDVINDDEGHEVRCIIQIENWTKWLLAYPASYTLYGGFREGFMERDVLPAHRELIVATNELDSITGSSGTVAWELGAKNVHFIVMWSIPYNKFLYNLNFAVGMVKLTTKFTSDMLPYWYRRMYSGEKGSFKQAKAGQGIVFKHRDVFIIGQLQEDTYHPVLNVSIMPWSTKDLAPSVWRQLYFQRMRERGIELEVPSNSNSTTAAGIKASAPSVPFSAAAVTFALLFKFKTNS